MDFPLWVLINKVNFVPNSLKFTECITASENSTSYYCYQFALFRSATKIQIYPIIFYIRIIGVCLIDAYSSQTAEICSIYFVYINNI